MNGDLPLSCLSSGSAPQRARLLDCNVALGSLLLQCPLLEANLSGAALIQVGVRCRGHDLLCSNSVLADPLKFMAGLEITTFVDYSLSIKVRNFKLILAS